MSTKSDSYKIDEQWIERIRKRRLLISTEGKTVSGISPNVDPDTPPVWYDKATFNHAQKLFKTYSTIIRLSQFIGLNLVLYHTSGLVPLLVTGNSKTVSKLFIRYLSTIIHVNNWFEFDPFDKNSKAYRSLKMVRGMHCKVATKMNNNLINNNNNNNNNNNFSDENGKKPELWIAQYGMSHAQMSFIGMMAIFPKELGFHNFTSKDFHAMFHFWRVIGYCLGIDDRYNLCDGSDEDTVELCRQIYYEEWLPVIRIADEKVGIAMGKGISNAMSRVSPNLQYNSYMKYCAEFLQLNPDDYPLETRREKVLYAFYRVFFKHLSKSACIVWIISKLNKIRIQRAIARKNQHQEYLKEAYPDVTFENDRCPYDVNFEYINATEIYQKSK